METQLLAHLEFHGADPVEDFAQVLPDHGPGDLVVALSRGLHRVPRHVVEGDHVGEDAHRLVERAEPEGRRGSGGNTRSDTGSTGA